MGQVRPWWDDGPIATASTAIPSSVPQTGGRVQEIRMFFVFIDFQRTRPCPDGCRVGARTAAPRPAAVRCRRALTPRPKPFRAIDRSQRPAHRLKRDWRPCSHGKTTAVAETAEHPPTPFGRGMPPRRRGRIAETSGESIYQRIALARTFYPRRRERRSRHARLPPNSSATAWKTTPTTL